MKIALVALDTNTVAEVFDSPPQQARLPGIGSVSPVEIGWKGGGQITYHHDENGKEYAEEGPPRFALLAVDEAADPVAGKRVARLQHRVTKDRVIEEATYVDAPETMPLSPVERIERVTGLTLAEIKQALGVK